MWHTTRMRLPGAAPEDHMPLAADRVTFDDNPALLILDPAILTDDVAREVWHRLPLLLRGERGRVKVALFEVFRCTQLYLYTLFASLLQQVADVAP